MFVITADQVGSRSRGDLAGAARDDINDAYGATLLLPADRNAGDEVQAITDDAATVLAIVLELTREREWSVGLGWGPVRTPLPEATREASGPAFFAARDAVDQAKKSPTRFAARLQHDADTASSSADTVTPLLDLLLILRERRSAAGWELYDLLSTGISQRDAAGRLGISPPSVSARGRVAGIRAEQAAIPALTRLLQELDRSRSTEDAPA
jgi:hypothetical protein